MDRDRAVFDRCDDRARAGTPRCGLLHSKHKSALAHEAVRTKAKRLGEDPEVVDPALRVLQLAGAAAELVLVGNVPLFAAEGRLKRSG